MSAGLVWKIEAYVNERIHEVRQLMVMGDTKIHPMHCVTFEACCTVPYFYTKAEPNACGGCKE